MCKDKHGRILAITNVNYDKINLLDMNLKKFKNQEPISVNMKDN